MGGALVGGVKDGGGAVSGRIQRGRVKQAVAPRKVLDPNVRIQDIAFDELQPVFEAQLLGVSQHMVRFLGSFRLRTEPLTA